MKDSFKRTAVQQIAILRLLQQNARMCCQGDLHLYALIREYDTNRRKVPSAYAALDL